MIKKRNAGRKERFRDVGREKSKKCGRRKEKNEMLKLREGRESNKSLEEQTEKGGKNTDKGGKEGNDGEMEVLKMKRGKKETWQQKLNEHN